MERASRVALFLIVAACALAACGGGASNDSGNAAGTAETAGKTEAAKLLDTGKLESLLRKLLSVTSPGPIVNGKQTKASNEVTSVSCPSRVKQEKGATFTCRLTAIDKSAVAGTVHQTGQVSLTQQDSEGRTLKYRARLEGGGVKTTQSGKLPLK